jgi:ACS family hexuronate transporter-like MFS transporter
MRKIKGLRWYMIALVTLGTVLGYLTVTPWRRPRRR